MFKKRKDQIYIKEIAFKRAEKKVKYTLVLHYDNDLLSEEQLLIHFFNNLNK